MQRYAQLLETGYQQAGWEVRTLRPWDGLSKVAPNASARKILAYIESLILFPATLVGKTHKASRIHLADHSDAPWLFAARNKNTVVTCHDLIAQQAALGELPEHTPRISGRLYQRLIRAGLRRATVIACVSRATLADAERIIPGPEKTVIYNPLDPAFEHTHAPTKTEGAAPKPYFLMVSSSGWRKRRELSLKAWKALQEELGDDYDLVSVGPAFTRAERLAAFGTELAHSAAIHEIEHINDRLLQNLYSQAVALLHRPLYEGFGWPVLEANASGTIAICSQLPVFREIAPDNIYIDDDDDVVDWGAVASELRTNQRTASLRNNAARFSFASFITGIDNL